MAPSVRAPLSDAALVVTSCLTLIECDRVLVRAVGSGVLTEAQAASRRGAFLQAAEHWVVFDLDPAVVERARRPFPAEPVRTLDAIHLATATLARSLVPDLSMLSLDDRVRRSAEQMGWPIVPPGL